MKVLSQLNPKVGDLFTLHTIYMPLTYRLRKIQSEYDCYAEDYDEPLPAYEAYWSDYGTSDKFAQELDGYPLERFEKYITDRIKEVIRQGADPWNPMLCHIDRDAESMMENREDGIPLLLRGAYCLFTDKFEELR